MPNLREIWGIFWIIWILGIISMWRSLVDQQMTRVSSDDKSFMKYNTKIRYNTQIKYNTNI